MLSAPLTPPDTERAALAATIAYRQHGVLTRRQLRACGFDDSAIHRRVHTGVLHRIHHGVYGLGHARLSREGRDIAAVLAVGDDAALSHTSAAVHWGMWRSPRRPSPIPEVSTNRRVRPRLDMRIYTERALADVDVVLRNDVPVTTVERTLLDLAEHMTVYQLVATIAEAQFADLFRDRDLVSMLARASKPRAAAKVRAALAARRAGSRGTRSGLEDRMLAILPATLLASAVVCVPLRVGGTTIEPDVYWPDHGLVVEVDGEGHELPETAAVDAWRDGMLREAGIRVLRFDREAIERRPRALVARIVRATRKNFRM